MESEYYSPKFYCKNYSGASGKTCKKQCFDCMSIVGERQLKTKKIIENLKNK